MNYFEERFKAIIENFKFSLLMYRHDPEHCEQCYKGALGEIEAIFNHHDCHDSFSKRLMNLKNSYQRQLKKVYLGF